MKVMQVVLIFLILSYCCGIGPSEKANNQVLVHDNVKISLSELPTKSTLGVFVVTHTFNCESIKFSGT